ncbi:MAG: hypothetical protein ACI9LS_002017, partial [Flavobacteriales bacterium]
RMRHSEAMSIRSLRMTLRGRWRKASLQLLTRMTFGSIVFCVLKK